MADGAVSKPKIVRGVAKRHAVKTMSTNVGAWWTDLDYAAYFVRWAGIKPGMRVIDLGAGVGNLSLALLGVGAIVTSVEIDPKLEGELRQRLAGRARIIIGDVFATGLVDEVGRQDAFVDNGPWEGTYEVDFLRRGLEFAPRGAGIMSLDGLVGQKRDETGWRHMRETAELRSPSRQSFSRNGSTGQEHAVGVQVVPRLSPRQEGDVDLVAVSYYRPARKAGR